MHKNHSIFDDPKRIFSKRMKAIFASIFSILFCAARLFAQTDSCDIRILVEGITPGKVKLIGAFADQNYLADSTMVDEHGVIEFKRKSPLKPGYFYVILPDYSNLHFLADTDQHFVIRTKRSDLFGAATVEGSSDNEMLYASFRMQLRHEALYDSVSKAISGLAPNDPRYLAGKKIYDQMGAERKAQLEKDRQRFPNSFYVKFKYSGQNPEVRDVRKANGDLDTSAQLRMFRNEFWDNFDFRDERLLYTPVIANKIKTYMNDLTMQNPDSLIAQADILIDKSLVNQEMFKFISNWLLIKYQPTKTSVMDGEAVFVHIIDKYMTKELATWYNDKELADIKKKAFEMRASLLNRKGPDVISKDPFGQTKSIYEMKEPYIIVFMYDTKCEHCQKETPLLRKFIDEWKEKNIGVFAIVLNSTENEWKEFMLQNRMQDWVNVRDPSNVSIYAKYFVDITPEIYILNRDRMIIGKNLKVEQIATIINRDQQKQANNK